MHYSYNEGILITVMGKKMKAALLFVNWSDKNLQFFFNATFVIEF